MTLRLLVIDDDEDIAELVLKAAEKADFQPVWAVGPDAIAQAYEEREPEVIVLDVLMPEMDGLEVLQYLRQNFSQAKIIILSGSDINSRRIAESLGGALGLQIVANLEKPFLFRELHALLLEVRQQLAA